MDDMNKCQEYPLLRVTESGAGRASGALGAPAGVASGPYALVPVDEAQVRRSTSGLPESCVRGRWVPAGVRDGFRCVPVLSSFSDQVEIGSLSIDESKLPSRPDFCFALGFLDNPAAREPMPGEERGAQWRLVTVAVVKDDNYAGYLQENRREAFGALAETPVGIAEDHARRAIDGVMAQREEILRAFVAKYGFQPDEAVQVATPDGTWRIERRQRSGVMALLKQALAALGQNATLPADIALARAAIDEAIRRETESSQAASEPPRAPSYDALLIIAQSVCGALSRAGLTDCDDPGEAIDVIRESRDALAEALLLALPYVTDAEGFPEQFKPGVVKRDVAQIRAALAKAGAA